MKNYPNQASSFKRVRGTLQTIHDLNIAGRDSTNDAVLGYEAAARGFYTFRGLDQATATQAQFNARVAEERRKPKGSQGAQTFARELRRTLEDMGWIDDAARLTSRGVDLLMSTPQSVEEQALVVEGLLNIEATNKDGSQPNHPVMTMLRLLSYRPSLHREGLELALEPIDDSEAEIQRVIGLYQLSPAERQEKINATPAQRANAVKIFPALAVYAGLVIEEDGLYSLSQDGWQVIGQAPAAARQRIARRRGRRMTVGRKVTSGTVATKLRTSPPRTLSPEEQARAAERLDERTASHQNLVKRMADLIGDTHGELFEDEFSYDLLWVPDHGNTPVVLFEMKTITSDTDAYARVRDAAGQLRYYEFFQVKQMVSDRSVLRVAVFDDDIPSALIEFLDAETVAVIVSKPTAQATGANGLGRTILRSLPPKQVGASLAQHIPA